MINKKGLTLVEIMIVVAFICFIFAIIIPNKENRQNQRDIKRSQEFDDRFSQEVEIKDNRFIIIHHDDHWGGRRIRVDTVQDTNTGKSYIIFRGYDGITALEIK